ncbi:MAG: hypothetical protein WB586_24985 [Chthoniobacterales bacterium]
MTTLKRRRRKLKARVNADRTAGEFEWAVPVRWLKQLIAVFLVPPAYVLTRAFFSSFSRVTVHHAFWASEEFWFFTLGAILWLITFFGLPKPILMYVFGHEFTHILSVWLMGGRVTRLRISRAGGHIVTDTSNFWISLAPYFFPIYSILVLFLYAGVGSFVDLEPYRRWLYGLVGFTWTFHVTFTVWMLWNGQTDLIEHGTFFSMMVIYLMNFFVLSLMLIVASRDVTFTSFGRELLTGAMDLSDSTLRVLHLKN